MQKVKNSIGKNNRRPKIMSPRAHAHARVVIIRFFRLPLSLAACRFVENCVRFSDGRRTVGQTMVPSGNGHATPSPFVTMQPASPCHYPRVVVTGRQLAPWLRKLSEKCWMMGHRWSSVGGEHERTIQEEKRAPMCQTPARSI
jgi:hypothetical protein